MDAYQEKGGDTEIKGRGMAVQSSEEVGGDITELQNVTVTMKKSVLIYWQVGGKNL